MNHTVSEDLVRDFRIYKKDNNLDKKDNLDDLPEISAIYAICSRINGEPSNCRHVNITDNLQKAIKLHFSNAESDDCLREFMQSIKIKTINYKSLEGCAEEEKEAILKQWQNEYKPECNEELNKVY